MIVLGAVVPYADVLFTEEDTFLRTLAATEQIGELITQAGVDQLLCIHTPKKQSAHITVQADQHFSTKNSLKSVGILEEYRIPHATGLTSKIQSSTRHEQMGVLAVHETTLHASVAGALKLMRVSHNIPLSIVRTGTDSVLYHAEFGYLIKDVLHNASERIGIIMCDTFQSDTTDTPQLLNTITQRSIAGCTQLERIESPVAGFSHSMALVTGILRGFPTQTKLLAHEHIHSTHLITGVFYTE